MPTLPTSGPLFRCPVGIWAAASVTANLGAFPRPGSRSESVSAPLSAGPGVPLREAFRPRSACPG